MKNLYPQLAAVWMVLFSLIEEVGRSLIPAGCASCWRSLRFFQRLPVLALLLVKRLENMLFLPGLGWF